MAKTPEVASPAGAAQLTPQQMRDGISRLNRRIADLEAFDVGQVQTGHEVAISTLEKAVEEALVRSGRTGRKRPTSGAIRQLPRCRSTRLQFWSSPLPTSPQPP